MVNNAIYYGSCQDLKNKRISAPSNPPKFPVFVVDVTNTVHVVQESTPEEALIGLFLPQPFKKKKKGIKNKKKACCVYHDLIFYFLFKKLY